MKLPRSSEILSLARPWALLPLAFLLLYGAFWALRLSDPGLVFVYQGHSFHSSENLVRLNKEPRELTVVASNQAVHPKLRMHLIPCPPWGWPECSREKPIFSIATTPIGQINVRYPPMKGTPDVGVYRDPLHPLFLTFWVLLLAAFLLLYKGEARILAAIVILSCGLYFSITTGLLRGLDVRGHVAHVERIALYGFWVKANACWECYQPPFYYEIASAFLGWPTNILAGDETRLQGLALLFHCLSIPFIIGSLRRFTNNPRDLLLFSALVCLWPSGILQSVRLGNDGLLNLLAFASLYYLLHERWRTAAMLATLGFLVKNSGIVLVALSAAWISWNVLRARISLRPALACAAIVLAGLVINKGIQDGKEFDPRRLSALPAGMRVPPDHSLLLLPDPLAFLSEPYVNPWVNSANRNHLPNYFWKSSLFGEWSFLHPYGRELAVLLSWILALILGLVAALLFEVELALLPALAMGISFFAIVYFRSQHPFADAADFRFVYAPVVLSLALVLAQARSRGAAWLARGLAGGMIFVTQVFFGLYWLFESR